MRELEDAATAAMAAVAAAKQALVEAEAKAKQARRYWQGAD
jgi:hypothetical protein